MSSPITQIRSSLRKYLQQPEVALSVRPKRGGNPQVIDISDGRQVDHWSRYFGVSPALLRSAVLATGGVTTDVWRMLAMR